MPGFVASYVQQVAPLDVYPVGGHVLVDHRRHGLRFMQDSRYRAGLYHTWRQPPTASGSGLLRGTAE